METGWDPKATKMFRKIINSISLFLLWLMISVTAGFYFKLAMVNGKATLGNIIFYVLAAISFLLLIRYLYKTWKDEL